MRLITYHNIIGLAFKLISCLCLLYFCHILYVWKFLHCLAGSKSNQLKSFHSSVALNYQTKCDEMDFNFAKFRQNGNCGYILKPEYMRNSFKKLNTIPNDSKKLIIKIVTVHQIGGTI